MARLRLVDYVLLHTAAPLVALTLVEVVYNDGGTETYTLFHGSQVPMPSPKPYCRQSWPVCWHMYAVRRSDGLLREALSTSVAGALLLSLLQAQRRIAAGLGELGAFATEASQEARGYAAPLAGGRVHHRPVAEPTPLAILQGYVRSAGSGWDYTVGSLSPSTRRCVRC